LFNGLVQQFVHVMFSLRRPHNQAARLGGDMAKLVQADDGLPAEEVGEWVDEKHRLLRDYIQISSATRRKYLPPRGPGGAAYIDLFCGPGRAKIKSTGRFVNGGCVAAWRKSVESGAPFSRVIIGDTDEDRLAAATERLRQLNAPVDPILGPAKDTAFKAIQKAGGSGLHLAFLDPYSIGALEFQIFATLARLRHIDMIVHVSQMDLQRNFDRNTTPADASVFDTFAPGWRTGVDIARTQKAGRVAFFEYWKDLVAKQGVEPAKTVRLITGSGNQPLYLLLLIARHELPHRFWNVVAEKDEPQGRLDL
jgi:three-Cys-motif partner protein